MTLLWRTLLGFVTALRAQGPGEEQEAEACCPRGEEQHRDPQTVAVSIQGLLTQPHTIRCWLNLENVISVPRAGAFPFVYRLCTDSSMADTRLLFASPTCTSLPCSLHPSPKDRGSTWRHSIQTSFPITESSPNPSQAGEEDPSLAPGLSPLRPRKDGLGTFLITLII